MYTVKILWNFLFSMSSDQSVTEQHPLVEAADIVLDLPEEDEEAEDDAQDQITPASATCPGIN